VTLRKKSAQRMHRLEDRAIAMLDLSICPPEILALDPNAAELWRAFLKRTGISLSVDGSRVIDGESRRAWVIRNLGIPSLVQRLASAKTEMDRARIWWRESVACSPGDSIPDLSAENLYLLNPFLVTAAPKFPDPRSGRLAKAREDRDLEQAEVILRRRGRPPKSAEQKRATNTARQRRFQGRIRGAKGNALLDDSGKGHFSVERHFSVTAPLDSTGLSGGEN